MNVSACHEEAASTSDRVLDRGGPCLTNPTSIVSARKEEATSTPDRVLDRGGPCLTNPTSVVSAREEETASTSDRVLDRGGPRVLQHRQLQLLDGDYRRPEHVSRGQTEEDGEKKILMLDAVLIRLFACWVDRTTR